ncbi:MAG: hypothetical protein CMH81_01470 [Nitrospiraceae bacterium]|nr:hypothetical protein [Nitrospiraceae bacterium]|tara:strand:- start:750 stop:1952 length:1203 start_codon:yes stop_codon:yes gene_type:complete
MGMRTLLIVSLSLFFSLGEGVVYAGNSAIEKARELSGKIKDGQAAFEGIRRELTGSRRDLDNAEKRESSVLDELQRIDQARHAKQKALKRLIHTVDQAGEDSKRAGKDIDGTADQLKVRRNSLRARVKMHYKAGRLDAMTPLLASRGMDDGHLHDRVFSSLSRSEYDKTQQKAQELATLEQKKREHDRMAQQLLGKQREIEAALAVIQAEQKKKRRLIARIHDEQDTSKRTIAELEASSAKIEDSIRAWEEDKEKFARLLEAGNGLTEVKGALHWPNDGKVVAFFGHQKHPKFDTFLERKGIDIKAKQGSAIRSSSDGVVAFADWLKGYGLLLIIAHGLGDVSLYAHASSLLVDVDDQVKAGQLVGTVGDTGLTGNSMLYFEVRAGGKAVDPIKWLVARK